MGDPVGTVRAVTVDVSDLDRGVAFWGRLLGLQVRRRSDVYVWFDEVAPGVRLVLQRVPETKRAKTRSHLDLASSDPEGLISLALSLGGAMVESVEEDDYALSVLTDPDGNEFCIANRQSSALTADAGLP